MRTMSGAVSSSVPSRSRSTAARGMACRKRRSTAALEVRQVVDAGIGAQARGACERIEFKAADIPQLQSLGARQSRELGRPQQPRILVSTARNQIEQVFGS